MKKFLLVISLVMNSPQALADEGEDVRAPQTYKEQVAKKGEDFEDKEATKKYEAEKEKKYHERTHKWKDKAK